MACLQAQLHGMIPVHKGVFEALQPNAAYWSSRLKQAAAVCNGLTWVSKNTVAGDDFDRKLFNAVEARFVVSQMQATTLLPTTCMHPTGRIGKSYALMQPLIGSTF